MRIERALNYYFEIVFNISQSFLVASAVQVHSAGAPCNETFFLFVLEKRVLRFGSL